MGDIAGIVALMDKHAPEPLRRPAPEIVRRAAAREALRISGKARWPWRDSERAAVRLPGYVVRAMYADYLRTGSTRETAAIYGRSDVALRGIFRRHNLPIKLPRRQPTKLYDGVIFHLTSDGRYYRATRLVQGKRCVLSLHQRIYENSFGPIQAGQMVVFRDGDAMNLAPSNLVALPRSAAMRLIRGRGHCATISAKVQNTNAA